MIKEERRGEEEGGGVSRERRSDKNVEDLKN